MRPWPKTSRDLRVAVAEILRELMEACHTNHSCFLANMGYFRIFNDSRFFLPRIASFRYRSGSRTIIGLWKALHYPCVLNLIHLPLCVLPFFPWPFMLARENRVLDDATAGFDSCACRSISIGAGQVVQNPAFVDAQTPLLYNSSGIRMGVADLRGFEHALAGAFT